MTTTQPERILWEYLTRLAERTGRGDAREESFYSVFEDLLRKCGVQLGRKIDVTAIPRKEQECLLDFQVWNGGRVAGYVEAKAPGTDLTVAAESEQLVRYRRTFPNLLLTDFREVRLFRHGELAARAVITGGTGVSGVSWPELSVVLDRFFSFGGVTGPASAAWLATALAGRARVLSARVLDLLREERERGEVSRIGGLLGAFREYLRAELDDQEFTDLYAQTIAYGLLAARLRRLDRFELRTVIENIPRGSGILRDVFEVLSLGELPATLRWIVEDLVDLLAAAPIQAIVRRDFDPLRRKDVIQHFYETFLQAFDKGLRKKRGVYYTPQPVVSFMVRSVQALLRSRFGLADGLADPGVVLLDPAAGTLTFLTEAFRVALEAYTAAHGPGGRAALVRDHLLPHFHAFEVMMAPYAIGHWRARLFFEEQRLPLADGQRVRLYLTNALELEEMRQTVFPFTAALARESLEAWRIKRETAVSVVIGNPPWSGHSANRSSSEIDEQLRKSYHQVDGGPLGERNPKWLQDDYVKFIRFGQTKIEQSGAGILCFVTPHGYLDSPTFRGLRRSLMATFDEMYFLDLHGNQRKRERGPDGEPDDNVFDGVAQGVAVAILIKKPGLARRVFHAEVLGSRTGKERWLGRDVERDCWKEARMTAPSYLIRAGSLGSGEEEYARGIPLPEIFPVRAVGVLTARDEVTIGFDREDLEVRIARLQEVLRRGDENPWRLDAGRAERVRRALADGAWRRQVCDILYRPFDRRVILYLDALVDRPRREGMRPLLLPDLHDLPQNIGLVLPRQARGELAAFVTDRMIAHKAVSAYDINSVFPLRLAPEELFGGRPNLGESFCAALGRAYGEVPSPEAVFDYVYAVLHSPRYRQENETFLQEGFPRIPFPADAALFARLSAEGAELVGLHLLRTERLGEPLVRCSGDGRLALSRRPVWERENGRVLIGGPGLSFESIAPGVWAHRIGGQQVLRHWLTARAGRILSLAEIEHFRRMATAVEKTLEAQLRIEALWPEAWISMR
jgi:hypothetical protein